MLLVSIILSLFLDLVPPSSFEASWTQGRHSPLLTEDLQSSGSVVLKEPSYLRWEVKEPVQSVTEFGADDSSRPRFRMPTEKDFKVAEEGEGTIVLEPLRRDLRQMFRRITVTLDPVSGIVRSVFLEGTDDGWTRIDFKDVK